MKIRNELNAALYNKKIYSPTTDRYPSDFSAICSGDTDTIRTQLAQGTLSLAADDRVMSEDRLRNTVYHFVLAASSIASACMDAGMGQTEADTLSDIYVRKADICRSSEGMRRLYEDMCLDFAERMQEIRKETVISLHIRKCIDYIYENLGADLSVKALAQKAGIGPAYLSRLFCKETGISLKRFVKEARVDTAQNLLRYSELPYPEISASLGFSTQSVFIAVFKEITGMTPKTYRNRYLGK